MNSVSRHWWAQADSYTGICLPVPTYLPISYSEKPLGGDWKNRDLDTTKIKMFNLKILSIGEDAKQLEVSCVLVGMPLWKSSPFKKNSYTLTVQPSSPTTRCLLNGNEHIYPYKNLCVNVCFSFIPNWPKLETTQMSVHRQPDGQDVVFPQNGIRLCSEKGATATSISTNESQLPYAGWKKLDSEGFHLYNILEKAALLSGRQNRIQRKWEYLWGWWKLWGWLWWWIHDYIISDFIELDT